jgi:Nucleotidyl transferase AbiEii toxin, Type IV TA system
MKRFSEDIDFKVAMPAGAGRNKARNERSSYRKRTLAALIDAGFTLAGDPVRRDENQFFSANLFYPSMFATGPGLRPHIRVEMSLKSPALPQIARPIASLIGMAQQKPPEITAFLCVDPVETAADKLSAFSWRVHARQRGSDGDDPTIVRHLHDLASLKDTVTASGDFPRLVRKAMVDDTGRGGEATASADPATLFAGMLERLGTDPLWATGYRDYVRQVSFAAPSELIGFDRALAAVKDLVVLLETGGRG